MKEIISRRFLIKLGILSMGGYVIFEMKNILSGPVPDYQVLQSTLEAMQRDGRRDSFVPEGEFTREIFETVQNATYRLVLQRDGDGVAEAGTAWCAAIEENSLYLVTSKHVVLKTDQNGSLYDSVFFARPNIDADYMSPSSSVIFALHPERDLAVLRVKLDEKTVSNLSSLAFKDEVTLDKGDKAMFVGFPGLFSKEKGAESYTGGSIGEVVYGADGRMTLTATAYGGFSGSPLVVVRDDLPLVVGTVTDKSNDQFNNYTHATTIEVDRMIRMLKKD